MTTLRPRKDNLREDQMETIYEFLSQNRVLFLNGPITGAFGQYGRSDIFSSAVVADTILALGKLSNEPIYLVINSIGGTIDDGFVLYDTMKASLAPIYTVARNCYSMATVIFAAGEKGHRYIYPNAKIMLHLPSGIMGGDSEALAIQNKEMQKVKTKLVNVLIESGVTKPPKQVLRDIDREFWLDAKEAINYGLADKIVEKGFLVNAGNKQAV